MKDYIGGKIVLFYYISETLVSHVCVSVCLPVLLSSEKWFSLTNDLYHNNHFPCLGAGRCLSQRSSCCSVLQCVAVCCSVL